MSKKDEHGEELTFEKLMDIYEDKFSIWKVNIERIREQDKNARVMDKTTFDQLKANIGGDNALESLPYGYIDENNSGNLEFKLISGHHRTRAARSAEVTEIIVLADNRKLTEDEVKSKQLAHNALSGYDDDQVLKEIYDSIEDVDKKIASGIRDNAFDEMKYRNVKTDDIKIDFDYKQLRVMFLSSQMDKFEDVVADITNDDTVVLTDIETFDKMAETIREVSGKEDIRALPSIFEKMCDIVKEYYEGQPETEEEN